MSYPDVLHVVEAVEKIFDLYNECHPDPAIFSVTSSSPPLLTVDVLKALLNHAITPRSVAKNFWQCLKPFFNDVLIQHGDPTNPQYLGLGPPNGHWTLVENKLLDLSDGEDLTEAMNNHAREWMTGLLLPSTFLSLFPLGGARMAIRSPLPREDSRYTPKRRPTAQKGWKVSSAGEPTDFSLYASNNIGL